LCYNPGVILDSHTHIFSPGVIRDRQRYIEADPEFAALYTRPSAKMVTADDLVDSMDKAGIDVSIVCGFAWTDAELCRQSNDYILESIARYPKRLIGLATIRPEDGKSALAEVERCVAGGVKGLGELRPHPSTLDSTFDSVWTPIVNLLIEHRLVCLFHTSEPVGHPYPGKGELTPQVLYPFIARHPGLKVILAHWGGGFPFYCLMPEVRKTLASTWFDTAASPYLYDSGVYRQVVDILGPEKILFGSDFPLMPQSRALGEIKKLNLPPPVEESILGGNANRLLEL
jgi:uncharacterized protein